MIRLTILAAVSAVALGGAGAWAEAPAKPAARGPAPTVKPAPAAQAPPPEAAADDDEAEPAAATGKDGKPKKGLMSRARGMLTGKPKLPEKTILSRFDDPAFPVADPNAAATSSLGLFGGRGPLRVTWPAATSSLQRVADEIAARGPRPDIKAKVVIAESDLEEARSYFSGPKGTQGEIALTTALVARLIKDAENDPKLAMDYLGFILTHEYSHLILKHPQQLTTSRKTYRQVGEAIQLAGMAYVVGRKLNMDPKASYAAQQRETQKSVGIMLGAAFLGEVVATESNRMLFPSFSKSVERDADMLAVDLMVTNSIDPRVGAGALKSFADDNKVGVQRANSLAAQAGKAAQSAMVQVAVAAPLLMLDKKSTDVGEELKTLLTLNAAAFALQKLDEHKRLQGVHLHDSADQRMLLVVSYIDRFHAGDPRAAGAAGPRLTQVDWKKLSGEIAGRKAYVAAKDALSRGDIPAARKGIDAALGSPIGPSPEVQEVAAGVATAENRPEAAIKHLRAVLASGYAAPHIFRGIANNQRQKKDNAGALKTLAEAAAKTGAPQLFVLDKIEIHKTLDDQKAVEADLIECRGYQDGGLSEQCERLAHPPPPPPPRDTTAQTAGGSLMSGVLDRVGLGGGSAGAAPPAPAPAPASAAKPKPKPKP